MLNYDHECRFNTIVNTFSEVHNDNEILLYAIQAMNVRPEHFSELMTKNGFENMNIVY